MFTLCQGYYKLCITALGNKQPHRHYGEALFLVLRQKVTQFPPVKEEFTVPHRLMLSPASPVILGYVHAADIQFPAGEKTVCILQGNLSRTDGFYLRTHKPDTGRIGLQELVIVRGPAVFYLYAAFGFWHGVAKISFFAIFSSIG